MQANTPWEMLPSRQRTRSAPRNSTRFAAQYSARGLPCERFTAALASRTSCITRGRGGWLDLPRGGLAPPILCQLSWRTRLWVTSGPIKSRCHRNIGATSVMMQASPSRIWTPTTARKTGEVEGIANPLCWSSTAAPPRLKHVHDQRREYPTQGNPVPPCPSIGPPSSPTGAQVSSGR